MKIVLNGAETDLPAGETVTLEEALVLAGYEGAHVATALNRDFVPVAERARTRVSAGDRIEIVAPMKGG